MIVPDRRFSEMGDSIEQTVDYDAVARRVRALVQARSRQLIETVAHEVAELILSEFAAREVRVAVEKHILPETDAVIVRTVRRTRD